MFIILPCFIVYYEVYGNNVWKQVLDSSFTVENFAGQLLEGLMRAEPATASDLIRAGALQNATAAEPGLIRAYALQNATAAAQTDSAVVNWKRTTLG
ncbi:hypothetical protein L195_g046289 [Trifolium pratense]|uniref:Uncharacterized protein n=1 Tax=Trifolium pratense TaxID=57577 RepID=A0A2K3MHA7_TRIPR|nr:hypothetical protein L195_g046289 [Trifolium pratense]